jgi:glycosyltransferase involved in cell wall biosynthesis
MAIRVLQVFGGGVRSGIETHILALAKGLKGSDVELVLAPLNKGSFGEEVWRPYAHEIIESDKKYRGDLGFVRRLANRIKTARIDIVHTHSFDGNFYGSRAARQAGIKNIVNTVHTFEADAMIDIYKSRIIRKLIARQNRSLLRSASHLIAVCKPIKEKLVREGFDTSKITVVRNGLDLESFPTSMPDIEQTKRDFGLSEDAPIVGAIGRIARVKNFDVFIRAARIVLDRGVKAQFIIVGDGPLRTQMEDLASELRLKEDVFFVGWQSEIRKLISAMDLFALCSKTEGTSYTLLEAMALERPTVATAVGGNVDLVKDGETGLLIPPGDADATADAIFNLISDRDRSEQFGEAGRERVKQHFSARAMVDRTLEVYRELADDGAAASNREAASA